MIEQFSVHNPLGRKAEKGSRGKVDNVSVDSEREAETVSFLPRLSASRFGGYGYFGAKPNTRSSRQAKPETSGLGEVL